MKHGRFQIPLVGAWGPLAMLQGAFIAAVLAGIATSLAITKDDPELWTIDDVSRVAQVSPQTVYYWRYMGRGPRGIKLGRHLRFFRSDVLAWLEAQADKGAGDHGP